LVVRTPGERLVRAARRGRPPRPDPAVLAACAALREVRLDMASRLRI